MINTFRVFRVVVLVLASLGLAISANAQTNNPCTVTALMVSPAPSIAIAPEFQGWQISKGYEVMFTSSDLANQPFPTGATLDLGTDKQPIFGCTAEGHMLLQILSPAAFGASQIPTVMHRDKNGVWSVGFSGVMGKGAMVFPNPGSTGAFQIGAVFAKATHFLSNGNRLTMLSQFGAVTSDWRAYDINFGGANTFVFDFKGFPTNAVKQACITGTNLWFAVQVGTLTQIFGVDASGKLNLVPDAAIPAVNGNGASTVALSCYGSAASVQVTSADGTSSASYILADTRN